MGVCDVRVMSSGQGIQYLRNSIALIALTSFYLEETLADQEGKNIFDIVNAFLAMLVIFLSMGRY